MAYLARIINATILSKGTSEAVEICTDYVSKIVYQGDDKNFVIQKSTLYPDDINKNKKIYLTNDQVQELLRGVPKLKKKLNEKGKNLFYSDEVLEYKVQPLKETLASVFANPNDDPNDDDGEFTFNIVERTGKPITIKREEISYMGTEDNILDANKGYSNVTANYIVFKDDRPSMYCFVESKVTRKDKA